MSGMHHAKRPMTTEVAIRPLRPADVPRLQEIRAAAFEPVFRSFRDLIGADIAPTALATAESEQETLLSDACEPGAGEKVFVAQAGSSLVGFVVVSLDEAKRIGEIGLNAVHPEFAGRGIGTALYGFALDFMREAGMVVATVGTGGDPSHTPARRAYAKAGFDRAIPSVWLYRRL